MESFEESISRKRELIRAQSQQIPFRVAVLGPGEGHNAFHKRIQILQTLKSENFEAFFLEEIVDTNSPVTVRTQERVILARSDVDFIIILNSSEGALAELAAYAQEAEIVRKAFVLIPTEFYRPQQTYTTDVLEQYINRWRFDQEEFEQCAIVRECMTRARTMRELSSTDFESLSF